MVRFMKGDIFATPGINAYAHGCNCAGAMGKGIAVSFRKRWPRMYDEYKKLCKSGKFSPGDVFVWKAEDRYVFNLGTQKSWRSKAKPQYVSGSLQKMLYEADLRGVRVIALPRIGAGLGGLEWNKIREIIQKIATDSPMELYVCENFIEGLPLQKS